MKRKRVDDFINENGEDYFCTSMDPDFDEEGDLVIDYFECCDSDKHIDE